MSGILWRVSVNLVRLDELEAWDHAVRRLLGCRHGLGGREEVQHVRQAVPPAKHRESPVVALPALCVGRASTAAKRVRSHARSRDPGCEGCCLQDVGDSSAGQYRVVVQHEEGG